MYDLREFYKSQNAKIQQSYVNSLKRIKEIIHETNNSNKNKKKKEYYRFINITAKRILSLCESEKILNEQYFTSKTFNELLTKNNELYVELFAENYQKSYGNPTYCVNILGKRFGQLISYFYGFYREYVNYAFFHKVYKLEEYNQLFIDVFNYIKDNEIDYGNLKKLITRSQLKDKTMDYYYAFKERFDPKFRYYTDIIENSDLSDLKYLFTTGKYISENEIKLARFLQNYSEKKLKNLSKEIVKAYFRAFERSRKDLSKKSTVAFYYKIGMEKLYREIIKEFRNNNLETTVMGAYSTDVNKQYNFDHKFDRAFFFTEESIKQELESVKKGSEKVKGILKEHSGLMYFGKFGEAPFSPENKQERLKLNGEQQKLFQTVNQKRFQLRNKYIPSKETGQCIVSFPIPEIGEQFEQIFEETVEINMLDSDKYERIQQIMIDLLDQADTVHVKGKGDNSTNIRVKMQELKDPEKETNFVNSGASSNIPVGEVFTAPQLSGTNGVFHVEEAYLAGLKYTNLKLNFKNGFVEDYSCTNFGTEEENRKYIEENLLFPHKTLPMGEFAIGTNTLAYVMGKKYNIMNILPVVILEKTGPHIALGDTCFARQEDQSVYNWFTKKEIVARDNEKSIKRKTNMQEAYTYKHSDISFPFDSIKHITATLKDGQSISIIRHGKFVLEGTQELNEPLNES
ncbi:MAG: aminopeptidase [Candidatus Hodarchaeota archaeon]